MSYPGEERQVTVAAFRDLFGTSYPEAGRQYRLRDGSLWFVGSIKNSPNGHVVDIMCSGKAPDLTGDFMRNPLSKWIRDDEPATTRTGPPPEPVVPHRDTQHAIGLAVTELRNARRTGTLQAIDTARVRLQDKCRGTDPRWLKEYLPADIYFDATLPIMPRDPTRDRGMMQVNTQDLVLKTPPASYDQNAAAKRILGFDPDDPKQMMGVVPSDDEPQDWADRMADPEKLRSGQLPPIDENLRRTHFVKMQKREAIDALMDELELSKSLRFAIETSGISDHTLLGKLIDHALNASALRAGYKERHTP